VLALMLQQQQDISFYKNLQSFEVEALLSPTRSCSKSTKRTW
jgi:hypothetical protein